MNKTITAENAPALGKSGIAGIAVVSAIFAQKDIRTSTARLKDLCERYFS